MSMITALSWVPRGYAAEFPVRHDLDEEELDRISKLAQLNIDDANDAIDAAKGEKGSHSDPKANVASLSVPPRKAVDEGDLAEYDLDNYDSDSDDVGVPTNGKSRTGQDAEDAEDEDTGAGGSSIFSNIKSLAYHESNDDDPYITLKGDGAADSDDDDREDLQILPTDSLLLAAHVEDEIAHLEVCVFEDSADNLYVHHDIMLPDIPLCVEWLDYPAGNTSATPDSRANFVAVGTMDPDIEIWDLDTMDKMLPNATLGAGASARATQGKKKKKKLKGVQDAYHTDAVLALAANRQHRNLLASASADTTVKLWDVATQKCAQSYGFHTDKACSIAWHPSEATGILSGSYDRSAVVADMRAPESAARRWKVDADVEMVRWSPVDEHHFLVSTETGMLHCFDARGSPGSAPLWRLQAHEKALTSFAVCSHVPGLLATGSDDKTVKLWDMSSKDAAASQGPKLVTSKDLDVGRVFGVQFAPDEEVGTRLAVSGSKGQMFVWDTGTNKATRSTFASRASDRKHREALFGPPKDKERIIGVGYGGGSDGEDDDDDDDYEDDEEDDGEDDEEEESSNEDGEGDEDEEDEDDEMAEG